MSAAYQKLEHRFRRLMSLGEAEAILHWDMATMMPAGGAEGRGEQLATLKVVRHGMLTDSETAELLDAAESEAGLDDWRRANLGEMRRLWVHGTAVDEDLVQALSRACTRCETAWRTARQDSDFAAVLPRLAVLLDLVRQVARAKAERLGISPYDALLDAYEPDARAADIDPVFADLAAFLPGFLGEVLERQAAAAPPLNPDGPFPIERQRALGMQLMEALGFDFDHGRLDVSLHPFCGGTPDDIRITTRYDEGDFTSALMGVLHETGHALYERGLPRQWRGQPVGEARGMAMHESQSLLIEMQVCRSPAFLEYAAPVMAAAFGGSGPAYSPDNLARLHTRVAPGPIRVDADEVTYPAHVILRYNLEKAMIEGDMEAGDLPGAWNEAMRAFLGLTPADDREGCLQDIHWFDGAWGYFPTYTLGALMAAQLYAAAKKADGDIEPGIRRGDFRPLFGWLGDTVHGRASSVSAHQIIGEATGRPLDANFFKAHLAARYLDGGGA